MFVLLLAILGLLAVLTRLVSSQGVSSHQTAAFFVASGILRRAEGAGAPDWGVPETESERYVEALVGQTGSLERFHYKLVPTLVPEPSGSDAVFQSGTDMGNLYELEVTVWWAADSSGPSGSIEKGERRVRLGRLIYAQRP